MKKMFFILLSLFMVVVSCTEKQELVANNVEMSPEAMTFVIGDLPQPLIINVLPEEAIDRAVSVECSDPRVAYYSGGMVSAYKAGECDIIATTNNGITAKCHVVVTDKPKEVSSLILPVDNFKVIKDEVIPIEPSIFPVDAANKNIKITIADPSLLSNDGFNFKGLAEGNTIVTFTSESNPTVSCSANVEIAPRMEFVDDRDGKVYKTVKIGNQIWFAENFAYITNNTLYPTTYKSSFSPVTYVYDYEGENVAEAKATENYKVFGALYNRQAAEDLCPDGWHLPTKEEWQELELYIGMTQEQVDSDYNQGSVADKLKALTTWTDLSQANDGDEETGNNETGFSALAGGTTCEFWTWEYGSQGKNIEGTFWSNTHNEEWTKFYTYSMRSGKTFIYQCFAPKEIGLSVRYVKDAE